MGQTSMTMITVTARFNALPGKGDELVPLLAQLSEHSRGEPGSAGYGYFRKGDDFLSIEHWTSPEAETAHNDTDYLRAILKKILPLLDGKPQVTRWEQVA